MPDARRLGTAAEDQAAAYLLGLGYTLVKRRYKARHGEIDIIALDGETLVFVEVKMRSGNFESPEDTLGSLKRSRFELAVAQYFEDSGTLTFEARYDLVAIDNHGLRHYKDAFRV